ncbi:TPA: hypothetical protein NPP51_003427 [Klebsiella quasipneumoniae subsp. quasipneumoniae]|nr:hypothetical protein [Klebsiella quasipneumoniae subsp. quasipneumoniae]
MKKAVVLAFVVLLLAGCDNKFQLSKLLPPKDPPSIAEMISSGNFERASECKKGAVAFGCEFITAGIIDSTKWYHTEVYLNSNGKVDMTVDGKVYFQDDVARDIFAGKETASYSMKALDGSRGTVTVTISNAGVGLTFDAYSLDGKRFVMGGAGIT